MTKNELKTSILLIMLILVGGVLSVPAAENSYTNTITESNYNTSETFDIFVNGTVTINATIKSGMYYNYGVVKPSSDIPGLTFTVAKGNIYKVTGKVTTLGRYTISKATAFSSGTAVKGKTITLNVVTTWYSNIFYDANGGSGAPTTSQDTKIDYQAGTAFSHTIPTTTPILSGYKFLGWSTTKYEPGTGTAEYVAGETFDVAYSTSDTDGTTLYAVWEKIIVTGITLDKSTVNMSAVNETATLTATVAPDNAYDKSVTWSSSNEAVATVSDAGVVTATGAGIATITCTAATSSGVTATCTVSVTGSAYVYVKQDGSTVTADGCAYYSFDKCPTIEYDSDNNAVMTINGNVVAKLDVDEGGTLAIEYENNSGITALNEKTITVGDAGYSTYYSPFQVQVPEDKVDVKVFAPTYSGNGANTGKVSFDSKGTGITYSDGIIPAGTGLLLKNAGSVTFSFTNGEPSEITSALTGTAVRYTNPTPSQTETYDNNVFVLSKRTPGVAFYQYVAEKIPAGKAYLLAPLANAYQPSGNSAKAVMLDDDFATAIDNIDNNESESVDAPAYNVLGQSVNAKSKGIVIINGKKYFNK